MSGDPTEEVEQKIIVEQTMKAIRKSLSETEMSVITLRYGLIKDGHPMVLKDVANKINLTRGKAFPFSRERIRLIEERALLKAWRVVRDMERVPNSSRESDVGG